MPPYWVTGLAAAGGHPRNFKNLELQPWEGEDGAKKKDRLERRLQLLVCAEKVSVETAQRAIYFDWKSAFHALCRRSMNLRVNARPVPNVSRQRLSRIVH